MPSARELKRKISGKTVAVGVAFTETKGTLHYQGQSYRVQMQGLSLAQAGASNIEATDEVYHLNRLQDISGNYAVGIRRAALVDGHAATAMTHLTASSSQAARQTDGVDLRLSLDAVSLTLDKPDTLLPLTR